MTRILRRILIAAALTFGALTHAAHSAPPPPVPALPDTARITTYTPTASTGPFDVGFQLYGDSTDYGNWVEVWLNGVKLTAVTDYTLTSPTGQLNLIPRPVTDGRITLVNPATGTLQIVGARRPRRASVFTEGAGVTARDLNQVINDITSQNRETWDKTNDVTGRAIQAPPGETLNLLAAAGIRASKVLGFDALGALTLYSPASAVTDSASVSFLQSGAGAIAWNLQARLRQTFNIFDYGAVCDGSNDDTTAIQNAINAAQSATSYPYYAKGQLYAPAGYQCKITSGITINAPIEAAFNSIIFYAASSGEALTINSTLPTWNQDYHLKFQGFTQTVGGNSAAPSSVNAGGATAVRVNSLVFSTLDVGIVRGFTRNAIWLDGSGSVYAPQTVLHNTITLGQVIFNGYGIYMNSVDAATSCVQANRFNIQNIYENFTNIRMDDDASDSNTFNINAMDNNYVSGYGIQNFGSWNIFKVGYTASNIRMEATSANNTVEVGNTIATGVSFTDLGTNNHLFSSGADYPVQLGSYVKLNQISPPVAAVSINNQDLNFIKSALFAGTTSGGVTIKPQAAAGTYNYNLPTSSGSAGNVQLSGGGGASPMTWGSLEQITPPAAALSINNQALNFVRSQQFTGSSSGTITLQTQAAAGTYNWNWPTTAGSSGDVQLSGGGGSNPMTWLTPGNLSKTDDTNVTLTLGGTPTASLLRSASLTLGWTGTLAAGRLNSNVVQGVTNDTNVTGSISAQNLTLGWTGSLAVSRGGTGDTGTAWSSYTPTIGCGTGSLTSASATGRSKTIGKTTFVGLVVTIPTNGTCGTFITATLPSAVQADTFFGGKARAVSGKLVGASVAATSSTLAIANYDNTYPGANGEIIVISGSYETP